MPARSTDNSVRNGASQRDEPRHPLQRTSVPVAWAEPHLPPETSALPPPFSSSRLSKRSQSVELPPLQTSSGRSPASVPSILNPSNEDEGPSKRRRKASKSEYSEAPRSILPSLVSESSNTHLPAGTHPSSSPVSAASSVGDSYVRRFMTPRSPSLHSSTTLPQLGRPTGTIPAKAVPFPTSIQARAYHNLENGATIPPLLPTPPPGGRSSYGFPTPSQYNPSGPGTMDGVSGLARPSAASDVSPKSSYKVHNGAREATPVSQYAASYASESDTAQDLGSSNRQVHIGVPISSSGGQGIYQMMTVSAGEGNVVHLPVDVQAASRVADEKRKRNAGASARFRQRRKEKEKESTTEIARLQQQVKNLTEDVDHYRRERDYLSSMIQAQGMDLRIPRPASPRLQRAMRSTPEPSGSSNRDHSYDREDTSDDGHPSGQRQTPTLPLAPPNYLQPGMPHPGTHYTPTCRSASFDNVGAQAPAPPSRIPPLNPLHGPSSSHSLAGPRSLSLSGPPSLMQAPPQTGPWNPYANDRK